MRRSKYVLGLIFIVIASFIITSCSESDKEENDNQLSDAALPLLGYWLLQEETDDYYYCSMLTFTKDCFYQVREQYKNETEGNLGTFSFDDRTNVITFNPTKDFSDEDLVSFSCQVLNVTETNLTIKTDEGELLNYTKTTNGTVPYYVWEEKIVAVAQAVDLGLPSGTKWASWNIGASTPQEYGDDYAWGELHTKTDFVKSTYQYYNSTSEKYDYIGNSICGNSQYDIAKHLWGGNWQLPSKTDFEELVKNCTMQWSNIGGVRGIMFYGKNDNSIFLPAGGARQHDNIENYCTYGTGTLSPTAEEDVYAFVAEERYGCDINTRFRFWGQSIRPVMK